MKRILFFSTVLFSTMLMLWAGCNQSPYRGFKKTESGIYYKFHDRSGDTNKPQLNELMTLSMRYGTEDSNIFDSKLNPRPMILPQSPPQYKGDIYEALSMMSKGDSATFILAADSFFLVTAGSRFVPDFIDSNGVLFFDVKMIELQTQEEYQRAEQLKNEERAKEESDKLQEYIQANNLQVMPAASGLYFTETTPGNGKKPREGDWVKVNFALSLLDKVPIYSSFEGEPASFEFGKQFENPGVTEALSMMSEGSRASLIVPSSLAFGAAGRGDIVPPYSTLLYDIQMLKIQTKEEHQAELEKAKQLRQAKEEKNLIESQRFLEQNSKKEGVITLPSGLQYKVITMGTGEKPGSTDMVTVNYHGTLINGTVFDSSIERGQPATFRVNGVIRGWTEALQLMPVGSKWTLYIPSELAYKNQQRGQFIEPNMALIFDVELLSISKE